MKQIIPFDDYNHRIHVGAEIVGSVLPTWGNHALANGWKLMEILSIGHGFRKTNTADLAPSLTRSSYEQNNFLLNNMANIGKVHQISYIEHFAPQGSGGTGYCEYDIVLVKFDNGEEYRVYVSNYFNGINCSRKDLWYNLPPFDNPREAYQMLSLCLPWIKDESIDELDSKYLEPKRVSKKHYRIRKLTPTECLRLMGVSDEDIDKMKGAGISDSQLYKMAGNSIVVQVLEGIFRNMDLPNGVRVFEAFAGYGSQSMALRNIGVEHEVVGISEIDKFAIMAYNATHPETTNYGDISRIDWGIVPDFDLFTYSFPCTDISNAGAQAGFEEGSGTRSSLLWDCRNAIVAKRPRYLLMENVKAITSKKFLPGLLKWQEFLSLQGYVNFIDVLNAKDYGIPQNRERCFLVSILDAGWYQFPEPVELTVKLQDILEEKVDEKYYLDQERVDKFIAGLSDEKREKLEGGCTV